MALVRVVLLKPDDDEKYSYGGTNDHDPNGYADRPGDDEETSDEEEQDSDEFHFHLLSEISRDLKH
jgi:hypothetical protein